MIKHQTIIIEVIQKYNLSHCINNMILILINCYLHYKEMMFYYYILL